MPTYNKFNGTNKQTKIPQRRQKQNKQRKKNTERPEEVSALPYLLAILCFICIERNSREYSNVVNILFLFSQNSISLDVFIFFSTIFTFERLSNCLSIIFYVCCCFCCAVGFSRGLRHSAYNRSLVCRFLDIHNFLHSPSHFLPSSSINSLFIFYFSLIALSLPFSAL